MVRRPGVLRLRPVADFSPKRDNIRALLQVPALVAGRTGAHSALHAAGPQAARIAHLWWIAFWISAVVLTYVVVWLLGAALHRRGRVPPDTDPMTIDHARTRRAEWVVGGSVAVTVVVLLVFLVLSVSTGSAVATIPPGAMEIDVAGHQWWWEVTYPGDSVHDMVTTANEIHAPVGRPVQFVLTSSDVIHSFWAPSLDGKRDLIPGHTTRTWFEADTVGVYRGQCAEFCGYQHAHMAFLIIADPPARFAQWIANQRQPAPTPMDSVTSAGQHVFLTSPCMNCHTIRGTDASGKLAPDLTHLASRSTIAAGTLPNTRGALAGWILDPQTIKPGNHMPGNNISPPDLQALLTYLQSLR